MQLKLLVVAILVVHLEASSAIETECPTLCKCHTSDIFCVGDGVSTIPDIPWAMATVYFRKYSIGDGVLSEEHINGTNATEMLTMENIGIETIADDAFASLPNLWMLDLEGNNLRSLKQEAFRGLKKLRELYLCRNKLTNFDSSFALLENLNFLDLTGNSIAKLTDDMFIGMRRYLQLIVSSNNISDLSGEGVMIDTYVSKIDLSNNPLNESSIEIGSNNAFYLDLSRVGFKTMPYIAASLTGLSLANNVIRKILTTDIMKLSGDYSRFRTLNFDNNPISFIQYESLAPFESLSSLHLTNNRLTNLYFQLPSNLQELHLSGNKVKEIVAFFFSNNTYLRLLVLSDNYINTLYPCSFCGLNELLVLDLRNNLIEFLPEGVFMDLNSLRNLNLQRNKLKKMASGCFIGAKRLTEINLSFLREDISFKEDVFDDLESLSVLNMHNSPHLARKMLKSPRIYRGLSEVTTLDISHNNLSTLDSSISTNFRRLRFIDLSVNQWNCSDKLLWLSKWIRSKRSIFLYLEDVNCTLPKEMQMTPIASFTEVRTQSTTELPTSYGTTHEPTTYTVPTSTPMEHEFIAVHSFTEMGNWHSYTRETDNNMPFGEREGIGAQGRTIFFQPTPSIGLIFGYSVLGVTVIVFLIVTTLLVSTFYHKKRHWFSSLTKFPGFLFKSKGKGFSVGYENVVTGEQDLLNFDN